MNEEKIFHYLSETKILSSLLQVQRSLIFIGDRHTITLLQESMSLAHKKHSFYSLDENSNLESLAFLFQEINHNSFIIISSLYDENKLYEKILLYVSNQSLKIKRNKILRLFADLLVNRLSYHSIFQSSEIELETPKISYAILTTPRSGSTFLCKLLEESGMAGYPAEHLRRPVEILARYCKLDYIRYLKILMTRQVTSNKVFGTKIISHFLRHYLKEGLNFKSFFNTHFSKIIYLQRHDKVGQAVSLYLAKKTNIWHIQNNKMREKYNNEINKISVNDCNLEEVKYFYDSLLRQEVFLDSFLIKNKIDFFQLSYEELVKNNNKCLTNIFQYLEVDIDTHRYQDVGDRSTNIKKTKSLLSTQLIEKFRNHYSKIE